MKASSSRIRCTHWMMVLMTVSWMVMTAVTATGTTPQQGDSINNNNNNQEEPTRMTATATATRRTNLVGTNWNPLQEQPLQELDDDDRSNTVVRGVFCRFFKEICEPRLTFIDNNETVSFLHREDRWNVFQVLELATAGGSCTCSATCYNIESSIQLFVLLGSDYTLDRAESNWDCASDASRTPTCTAAATTAAPCVAAVYTGSAPRQHEQCDLRCAVE